MEKEKTFNNQNKQSYNNSHLNNDNFRLLNLDAVEYYVEDFFKHNHNQDVYALFIIRISNLYSIKYTMGTKIENDVVNSVADGLSKMFRAVDVIGYDDNQFLVFMTSPTLSEEVVIAKANSITNISLPESVDKLNLVINVGIYISSNMSLSFKELYQHAYQNLSEAKLTADHIYLTSDINKKGNDNTYLPNQISPVPINFLLDNMEEDVRMIEVTKPYRLLYVSPNYADCHNQNDYRLLTIHPHDEHRYDYIINQAVITNKPVEDELRISFDQNNWSWRRMRVVRIPFHNCLHPVVLEISHDVTGIKKMDQHLFESGKMLKIAFENTTRVMWEVDVENKVYTFFNYKKSFEEQMDKLNDFPESLISAGWVHPDSASQFRRFGQDLLNGKTEGTGSFIMRYRSSDSYGWASLSYRMIFDHNGSPLKAIGVKNYLSDSSYRKQEIISSPALPDAIYPSLVFSIKVNLTEDSVKELWVEGTEKTDFASMQKYTDIIETERERLFLNDDSKYFTKHLSREALLNSAKNEIVWKSMKYRRVYISGHIHWVLNTVNLIRDPISNDVYLFNYLNDIETKHQMEYGVDIVLDPITNFYSLETCKRLIKNNITNDSVYAISLIHINSFSKMPDDEYGTLEEKQGYISAALNLAIGPDAIIGRFDEDTLIVVFKDITSSSIVKKRLEDAFSFVRSSMSGTKIMRLLRFIAGVECLQGIINDYDFILDQLERLFNLWKNSASDIVVFSNQGDTTRLWRNEEIDSEDIFVGYDEDEALTNEEKDVALKCLSYMAMSNSPEHTTNNILKYIGNYYHSDRVYILALAENNHIITMVNEWYDEGKFSIQRAVSGMRIEKFPFLCRCIQEQKPVFIKNKNEYGLNPHTKAQWNFMVIPIINQTTMYQGFFCLENPKVHDGRVALIKMMIKYLFNLNKNRQSGNRRYDYYNLDSLTNLPNLKCYTDIVDSINSDMYSSLGAVALDIPDLSIINSTQGFEFGSKLILHVCEILSEMFGRSYLFRTWDSEFVALCPNTTLDVFIDRCSRVRDILQRNYYKQIRIGYTWSGGVFFAKKLVKEAKAIMRCENIRTLPPDDYVSLWEMRFNDFGSAVKNGKFTVHFQPKIDMTTGSIVGAEALIRGIDDNNELIPPHKFIDVMEENGTIRDLDFYVLDRTFAYLEQWYLKGYDLMNVAVNISRVTLLDPAAPASVLAIQSRYPDAISGLIELEITESACDIEKATLSRILDNFRQFGLKFGLDDFGSHYSNISIFTNVKFDTIKLDRSLINELAGNEADRLLVKNIIQICKNGNMTCVAEGVETKAQVSALLKMGCSICQGYYYSKPLSARDFEQKWLDNGGVGINE